MYEDLNINIIVEQIKTASLDFQNKPMVWSKHGEILRPFL